MEEKNLVVKFHKGRTFIIPATIIAENRAKYYSELDGYDIESQEYLDEINRALEDEFLIFDWVQNNMNWSDLKGYATEIIDDEPLNLEDEWDGGNHTISVNY